MKTLMAFIFDKQTQISNEDFIKKVMQFRKQYRYDIMKLDGVRRFF